MRKSIIVVLLFLLVLIISLSISSAVNSPPRRDAYTSSAFPTSNFGSATTLRVSSVETSWIRFEVRSVLPPGTVGSQVAKATLILWVNTVRTPGSFDIHRVIGTWTQGGITHVTAPPVEGVPVATGVQVSGRAFILVDLTDLVKDWVDGVPNEGIGIVPSPGSGISVRFDSRENTGTSHEPQLAITLKSNGGNGGVPTGAIILWDGAECPSGFTLVTSYNDMFLVGSNIAGITGGSNGHTHDFSATVPPHTHPASTGPPDRTDGANPGGHGHAEHMHRHPVTIDAGGGGTISGTSKPVDSRPPFKTIRLCKQN